jgi:uncharacterized RDD family membrane protein YckC
MTTPRDPWQAGRPADQQPPRDPGAPGGYGPPQFGNAGHPAPDPVSAPPAPGYGPPPGYPPPAAYGTAQGYGAPPAGYGGPAGPGAPGGYGGPGDYPQQQSRYPAPGQRPTPPGAPGPIPEWWERLLGRLLDGVIFAVLSTILSSIVGAALMPSVADIVANGFQLGYGYYLAIAGVYLITGAGFAAYDVVMHSRTGQTLGKMALKTRLVAPNGGRPDQATLIRRAMVYPASGYVLGALFMLIPGVALSGLAMLVGIAFAVAIALPIFTDPLHRGLHDKFANTVVIKA